MTARREKELPVALAASFVVHALIFMLLVWLFGVQAKTALERLQAPAAEKEAVLVFPEQLMPVIIAPPPAAPAPPPPKKSEIYIRTTQNSPQSDKPKSASFISDRNTAAGTKLGPVADADTPMPTTEGLKIEMNELANRDYRDGALKDDSAPKQAASRPQPAVQAAEAPPAPMPSATITPPQPPTPPPPSTVAKTSIEKNPLLQMMEETDQDIAEKSENRLKREINKAEPTEPKPPAAPPPAPEAPKMRESDEMVAKALPVQEEVREAPPRPQDDAFMPHTRTSEVKGTISNRSDDDSVDAEDSPKGRYIRAVQSQIEKKWNLYRVLRRDSVTFGSLEVIFYVNSKGNIEDLRIVNDKQSNPMLSEFSLRAIRDAEIPVMPKDVQGLLPMLDKQRLKVEYNILIY